jgi:hypothetical protein
MALLGRLRGLGAPLASPEGLKRLLELALKVAEFAGLDDVLLDQLRNVLADEELLAFVARLFGRIFGGSPQSPASQSPASHVEAQALADWLPLVIQILKLLASLRAAK